MFSLGACGDDDGATSSITAVTAGTGLSGGGTEGEVTLSADTDYLQRRVDDTCAGNTAVQSITSDGSVSCSAEMALATHDHNADYSPIGHDHAGAYAPAAHDHDTSYIGKTEFNGVDTGDCNGSTGYIIIGNIQDEFGCRINCDEMCQRHGFTCDVARDHTGMMRACTYVANSAALYCWCKA
jgi:hypothetical protein